MPLRRTLALAVALTVAACTPPTTGSGAERAPSASSQDSSTRDSSSNDAAPPSPARIVDPEPGADRCSGYGLHGVLIGMTRPQVEKVVPITRLPEAESFLVELAKDTYVFKARRPGRSDEVQVGFRSGGEEPRVVHLRARIFVAKEDPWPASLFTVLGSPKAARIGEWIWWDKTCGATLRLTRVAPLGDDGGMQPYLLEIKRFGPE